jgi:hypothetical protein
MWLKCDSAMRSLEMRTAMSMPFSPSASRIAAYGFRLLGTRFF